MHIAGVQAARPVARRRSGRARLQKERDIAAAKAAESGKAADIVGKMVEAAFAEISEGK